MAHEFADDPFRDRTPIWEPSGESLLLPNLCIPQQYGASCDTYRFSLADAALTPIRPIYPLVRIDGEIEEITLSLFYPRLLPPLQSEFNGTLLLVIGVCMVLVGLARRATD